MSESILPGTSVQVLAEGLITAGSVATGNIGVVGTAQDGETGKVFLLSSLADAKKVFGDQTKDTHLMNALNLIYANGGRSVYAVRAGKEGSKSKVELTTTDSNTGLRLQTKEVGSNGNNFRVKINEPEDSKAKVIIEQKVKDNNRWDAIEDYNIESFQDLYNAINQKQDSKFEAIALDQSLADELPKAIEGDGKSFTGGANQMDPDYKATLAKLEQEPVNIVVLAGETIETHKTELEEHLTKTATIKRERIGIMDLGFGADHKDALHENVPDNERLIVVAPGIQITNGGNPTSGYTAAAVAGLLASLPVQTSPTNKSLVLQGLSTIFNHTELKKWVAARILVIEQRNGFRIVKGITTHSGAWKQITTRRIVDYAIYGVRAGCDPYIGKLNNIRVRGAMKATLDGFLTRMVENEALVSYSLEVSASRSDEKEGIAKVVMSLQPTFSIDFIQVTMYLD